MRHRGGQERPALRLAPKLRQLLRRDRPGVEQQGGDIRPARLDERFDVVTVILQPKDGEHRVVRQLAAQLAVERLALGEDRRVERAGLRRVERLPALFGEDTRGLLRVTRFEHAVELAAAQERVFTRTDLRRQAQVIRVTVFLSQRDTPLVFKQHGRRLGGHALTQGAQLGGEGAVILDVARLEHHAAARLARLGAQAEGRAGL